MSSIKYLDEIGGERLTANVKALLADKVDKVDGKQLSTEDFTTELKNKLDNMVSTGDNKIKTYTSLEDIGLSDDDMGATADDVLANMILINNALPTDNSIEMSFSCSQNTRPNFFNSLQARIEADYGFSISATQGSVFMRRSNSIYQPLTIEVILESGNYASCIFSAVYNHNASSDTVSRFIMSKRNTGYMVGSYTSLAQIGLSESDMVEDDFVANISTIVDAMGNGSEMYLYTGGSGTSTFSQSVLTKVNADLGYSWTSVYPILHIRKLNTRNSPVIIEVVADSQTYPYIYKCVFNNSASNDNYCTNFWVDGATNEYHVGDTYKTVVNQPLLAIMSAESNPTTMYINIPLPKTVSASVTSATVTATNFTATYITAGASGYVQSVNGSTTTPLNNASLSSVGTTQSCTIVNKSAILLAITAPTRFIAGSGKHIVHVHGNLTFTFA